MALTLTPVSLDTTANHRFRNDTLLETCLRSAAIGKLCPSDQSQWLAETCELIHQCFDGRARCTIAVFKETEQGDTNLELMSCSDGYNAVHDRFIMNCLELQSAEGVFLGMTRIAPSMTDPVTRLRQELLSDERWRGSRLFIERARLELHDFAWSAVRATNADEGRIIAIQLDGATAEWMPSETEAQMLTALTCVVRSSYTNGPLAERARQDALLMQLSPMRRRVAPMLASGLSETKIALKLERSKHTVHEHAKAIYQQWKVRSRRELRDLWLGREQQPQPTVRVA